MKKSCSQIRIPGSSVNEFSCTLWYFVKRKILFLLLVREDPLSPSSSCLSVSLTVHTKPHMYQFILVHQQRVWSRTR